MTRQKRQDLVHAVENFCAVFELILVRFLLLGCFTFEVCRFVRWLWIGGPH
jgi:hypothetical protein